MPIESYLADRSALLPLFALADDSPAQISSYMALGEVLVAREGDAIVGYLQIVGTGAAGVFELKSMAVREQRRRQGVGRGLVEAALRHCRDRGGVRVIVSTASADTSNLRFYQRQGFRMYRVVQDAFGPWSGYAPDTFIDGIPLRDQVFLECNLKP